MIISNKENVQVWDLATHRKLRGIRNDIGTMHAHIAIADDSRTAAYVQLRPKSGTVIFDLATGKQKRTILDEGGRIIFSQPCPCRRHEESDTLTPSAALLGRHSQLPCGCLPVLAHRGVIGYEPEA